MGRVPLKKPRRLSKKLRQIRLILGLSQDAIIQQMGLERKLKRTSVSNFERNKRMPSWQILLRYARLAGICLEVLVDDELDLPSDVSNTLSHDHTAKTSKGHANK